MSGEIRLLHVDDEPEFTDMSAAFLERAEAGIEVIPAAGAGQGLAILESEPIDCVVSDYDMPEQDGLTFLEDVRERFADLPFILFTGKGSEEVASEAIAAGATEYLQKAPSPDQYDLLVNRVTNAVEQFRTERERRRNERRFQTVFEDPNMLVQLLDREGRLLQANRRSLTYVERDADALTGELFWETPWWSVEQRAEVEGWIDRAITGEYVEFETECEARGESYHLIGTVRPVRETDDSVASLIVSSQAITKQKRRERELKEQTRALEAVLDTVEAGIYMKDAESRYALINQTWREQLGIPPEANIEGLTDYELFPAPIAARYRTEDRRVFQENEVLEIEHEVPTISGSRVHLTRKCPIRDANGSFEGICAVSTDITDRKRLERADRQLDIILSNAPMVLFGIDPDGTFAFLRGRGVGALDLEPGDVVGESVFDVCDRNAELLDYIEAALHGEARRGRIEIDDVRFQTAAQPVETNAGEYKVVGFAIDDGNRGRWIRPWAAGSADLREFG